MPAVSRAEAMRVLEHASSALYGLMTNVPSSTPGFDAGLEAMREIAGVADRMDNPGAYQGNEIIVEEVPLPGEEMRLQIVANIARERNRQITEYRHSPERDDTHSCLRWMRTRTVFENYIVQQPTGQEAFVIMQLYRVAALCVAQIEAINRVGVVR